MKFEQSSGYLAAHKSTADLRRTLSRVFLTAALVSMAITLLSLGAVREPMYLALCAIGRGLQVVGHAMGQDVWFLVIAAVVVWGLALAFFVVRKALLWNLAVQYTTLPPSPEQGAQAVAWANRNRRGRQLTLFGCLGVQFCAGVAAWHAPGQAAALAGLILALLSLICISVLPNPAKEPFCLRYEVVTAARAKLCPGGTVFADWCLSTDGLAWAKAMTEANLVDLKQPAGQDAFAKAAAPRRDREKGIYAKALVKKLAQALE
jgi:hypothetical protein